MESPKLSTSEMDLVWMGRLARSLVVDPNEAEDLVQESYLIAMTRPPASGKITAGWFATVMKNLLRLRVRTRGRVRAREAAVSRPESTPPGDPLEQIELAELILREIKELDPIYRDVIVYRYHYSLSTKEIAERLEIAVATVHTRLARAHAQLQGRLRARSDSVGLSGLLAPMIAIREVGSTTTGRTAQAGSRWPRAVSIAAVSLFLIVVAVVLPQLSSSMDPGRAPFGLTGPEGAGAPVLFASLDEPVVPVVSDPELGTETPPTATVVPSFSLSVIDAVSGEPISETSLGRWDEPAAHGTTGDDGTIDLPVDVHQWPGSESLVVSKDGYVPRVVSAYSVLPNRIAIQPGVPVTGRVIDASGAAVPHAEVLLFDNPSVRIARFSGSQRRSAPKLYESAGQRVRANAEGGFTTWVSSHTVGAVASGVGGAPGCIDLVQASSAGVFPELVIQLRPSSILRGVVVDAEGQPISGALVTCSTRAEDRAPDHFYSSFPFSHEAETDDLGEFEVAGVGEEVGRLHVTHPGYVAYGFSSNRIELTSEVVTLAMERGTRFTGRLLVPEDAPRPRFGFLVHRFNRIPLQLLEDGSFQSATVVAPPESSGVLWVDGGPPIQVSWSLESDVVDLGEIAFAAGRTQRFLIVDEVGDPLPGRWLSISKHRMPDGHWTAFDRRLTDANGVCDFPGLPDGWIRLEREGRLLWPSEEIDLSTAPDTIVRTEASGASISGTLTNQEGEPLIGVRVECKYDQVIGQNGGQHALVEAFTQAGGVFRLHDLPSGRPLSLSACGNDAPSLNLAVEPLDPNELREYGEIRAGGEWAVSGIVQNDLGEAIGGALVWLNQDRTASTDEAGQFRFDDVEDGGYALLAAAAGHSVGNRQSVTVAGSDRAGLMMTLSAEAPFSGLLIDNNGTPLGGARVMLISQGALSSSSADVVVTDAQGRYTDVYAPVRNLRMSVKHDDCAPFEASFAAVNDVPNPLIVPRGARLHLTYTTPEGQLVAPRLSLKRGGKTQSPRTPQEPSAQQLVRGLHEGVWQLHCMDRGRETVGPIDVSLVAGETTSVEIQFGALRPPLNLRLLDSGGSPAVGASVSASNSGSMNRPSRPVTDENGEITLRLGVRREQAIEIVYAGHARTVIPREQLVGDPVVIQLEPESILSIQVHEPDGSPMSGVSAWIDRWLPGESEISHHTLEGGVTRLSQLRRGYYDVSLARDGQPLGHFPIDLTSGETREIALTAEGPFMITGQITVNGQPGGAGSLSLAQAWIEGSISTTVDDEGRFEVELYGSGPRYVRYHFGNRRYSRRFVIDQSQHLEVDFTTTNVEGEFRDPDGQPVADLSGAFGITRWTRFVTDAEGRFSLPDVQVARYSLRCFPRSGDYLFSSRPRELDGSSPIVIEAIPARPIRFAWTGERPRQWKVVASLEDRPERVRRWFHDREEYRWPATATQGWVTAHGFAPFAFQVGEESVVPVQLVPTREIQVLTLDGSGHREEWVDFRVEPAPDTELPEELRPQQSDGLGICELSIGLGSYELVRVRGGVETRVGFTVTPGEVLRVVLP